MNNKKCLLLVLLLCIPIILNSSIFARNATPPVIAEEILIRIANEVSGSICFEHIRYLSTLHREIGFEDYHRAAKYVADKATEYGLKDVIIEKYPIKSKKVGFEKYIIPNHPLWSCQKGELRLVEPYPMLISHFESATGTVAPYSRSVNIAAEIVYVRRGDSEKAYKGKDVRGKIVLAEEGSHRRIHELAVNKFGALGTINFIQFKQKKHWEAIYPVYIGYPQDREKKQTFGFNLSTTKGLFLKDLLEKGEKVVVSCQIEAKIIEEGVYELPTAIIPGSSYPDQEFIFFAHLDHPKPGCHDNASGSAVILEIARTLSSLIQKKIIPPPKRTIRFMWVPHMQGLYMYFFNHPEKMGKIKGGCNLDSVGVDQAKYPSKFCVDLPSHSLPSLLLDITNNLVDHFNEKLTQSRDKLFSPEGSRNMFSATLRPFRGAWDEELVSTWPWSIPSISFHDSHLPPRHSQINFLEYIDRTNLKRISYLGAIISYAFVSMGDKIGPKFLNEITYRGEERLGRELLKAKNIIEKSTKETIQKDYAKVKSFLLWGIRREKKIAKSLREIISEEKNLKLHYFEYQRILDEYCKTIHNQLGSYYELKCRSLNMRPLKRFPTHVKTSWEKAIPVHNPKMKSFPGCFCNWNYFRELYGKNFLDKYNGLESAFRRRNMSLLESFNYIDGQNTIGDIYEAVQAGLWSRNYPPSPYTSISFELMTSYFRLLKDAQIIEFK